MYIFSPWWLPSGNVENVDVDEDMSMACAVGSITHLGIGLASSFLLFFLPSSDRDIRDANTGGEVLTIGQFLVTLPAEHKITLAWWDDVIARSSGELVYCTGETDVNSVAADMTMEEETKVSVVALSLFNEGTEVDEGDDGLDDVMKSMEEILFFNGAMVDTSW
jgi:hypothetical protein